MTEKRHPHDGRKEEVGSRRWSRREFGRVLAIGGLAAPLLGLRGAAAQTAEGQSQAGGAPVDAYTSSRYLGVAPCRARQPTWRRTMTRSTPRNPVPAPKPKPRVTPNSACTRNAVAGNA